MPIFPGKHGGHIHRFNKRTSRKVQILLNKYHQNQYQHQNLYQNTTILVRNEEKTHVKGNTTHNF